MPEDENRVCNCNNNMNTTSCGCNNNMNNTTCGCDTNAREELLKQIKCCNFAITELALYLDTHPYDTKAICLHNKYCKELKDLEEKYQKVYGPLTYKYPCNKWRWLEEPWPWEGGYLNVDL